MKPIASTTDGAQFAPEVFVQNSGTPADLRNDVLGLWWARESGLSGVRVQVEA
ncbi:MAG: hypothetical protein ACKVOO_09760 [Burkholderiaceae bacterium]